jgi:hypothetical protein
MNGINKRPILSCVVLTVAMVTASVGATMCRAQGANPSNASTSGAMATSEGRNAVEYDPKVAKRADLRIKYDKSPHASVRSRGSLKIDHSRMVDFINIQQKRSDLRMRVAKVGLEQAYAEWSHQTGSK